MLKKPCLEQKKDRQKTYALIEARIAIENHNRHHPPKEKPARVGTSRCCVFERGRGRYPNEADDSSTLLFCGIGIHFMMPAGP